MKNLPLAITLSQLAIENSGQSTGPISLIQKIERLLKSRPDILGHFSGKKLACQRMLGKDMALRDIHFDFEKQSIHLQLIRFRPRAVWQVQGIRFL